MVSVNEESRRIVTRGIGNRLDLVIFVFASLTIGVLSALFGDALGDWCQFAGYSIAIVLLLFFLVIKKVLSSGTLRACVKALRLVRMACRMRSSPHGGLVIISQSVRVGNDLTSPQGATITRPQYLQMLEDSLDECEMYFGISRVTGRELLDTNYTTIDGTAIGEEQIAECLRDGRLHFCDRDIGPLDIERARAERVQITTRWTRYFDLQIERAKAVGKKFHLRRVFVISREAFEAENGQISPGPSLAKNYWEEIVRQHYEHRELGFEVSYYAKELAQMLCPEALNQITVFGRGQDRWMIEVLAHTSQGAVGTKPHHEVLSPTVKVRVAFTEAVCNQLSSSLYQSLSSLKPWEYVDREIRQGKRPWELGLIFKQRCRSSEAGS